MKNKLILTITLIFLALLQTPPVYSASKTALSTCRGSKFFNALPLNSSDFLSIVPLGNLNPPAHTFPTDHLYFYLRRSNPKNPESAPAEVPLFSPGNGWITSIESSEHLSANPPYTDYSIRVSPCQKVEFIFAHVKSISSKLKKQFKPPFAFCDEYIAGGESYRLCRKNVTIKINPDEQIGTAGGRMGQNALDLMAIDKRGRPLPFANPRRWQDIRYAVCPLNYFAENTKILLEDKLGDFQGNKKRAVRPLCGQVEQDEPGKAQGAWFKQWTTNTFPEDQHIALVHDNVDPSYAVFSIGTSMNLSGLNQGTYRFMPEHQGLVNREFSEVRPGDIYCYQIGEQARDLSYPTVILLQLTSPTSLLLEKREIPNCGSVNNLPVFGVKFVEFER